MLTYLLQKQPNFAELPHYHFGGVWVELFGVLSSHVSTTDLIHSQAQPAIAWLVAHSGETIPTIHLQDLQSYAPIILHLVQRHDNTWPTYARDLLQALAVTCNRPFEEADAPIPFTEQLHDLEYTLTGH